MSQELKLIYYPDPILRKISTQVIVFDDVLKNLVKGMIELVKKDGVGLAAPQVGHNIQLFVTNPSGKGDVKVYINPVLYDGVDEAEGEEGCLSIPKLRTKVLRTRFIKIKAQDIDGNPINEIGDEYLSRIWQHEFDHLNGILIIDHMSPVARLSSQKILKRLRKK